jgi:hypothetical protein
MGIQVHRTLLRQHAHARGHLNRLIRREAPHPDILAQQQLLESLARVIDLQGMDEHWDREHTIEPRPKREFFPKGAYRRDALNILRRAERPLRVAEILDALCERHKVTLGDKDRAHAAIKLAQGIWVLVQEGFVVRADKEADHRSASCRYVLRQFASMPDTVNE